MESRRRHASRTEVDNSGSGAVYKGLAFGHNRGGNFLYAANFHAGTIDVFDKNFAPATLLGSFTDPKINPGFAPFNIQNLGGDLYVTYAKQDEAKHDEVDRPGHGYVDVFDTNGGFATSNRDPRPSERAVGSRRGASRFRTVRWRPPGRKLRRRHDQRVQPGHPHIRWQAWRCQWQRDRDRRPLGGCASGTAAPAVPQNTLFFTASINHEAGGRALRLHREPRRLASQAPHGRASSTASPYHWSSNAQGVAPGSVL